MRFTAPLCTLALFATLVPAQAQDAVDAAKAKAEGKVVWYTSTPIDQGQKIVDAFEKEYGIKVEMFRSGGSAILRRFQQEIDAGRVAVDVLTHSEPAAATRSASKGLFVAFKPKNFDKVPDAAKDPNGLFVAQRLNLMTHYLRSDKVAGRRRAEDLGRPAQPEIQGQAGDDRSVVHLAAGVGGRHDVEGARLGLLREAARQRHHDRAGQPAGRRQAQARRAADRGRRARFLCAPTARRRPSDQDALSVRTACSSFPRRPRW